MSDLDTQIEQILQGYADSHTSNQKHYGHVVLGGVVDYNFNLIADEAKSAIKNLIHKEVVKELESFLEHYRQFSWTGEEMKDMDYNPCGEALKARISHLQALQALQGGKE